MRGFQGKVILVQTLNLTPLAVGPGCGALLLALGRFWGAAQDDGQGPVYAIVDDLAVPRTKDVRLFSLTHLRWEFVFQPKYVAYLTLIEPWWKILRFLVLKGRLFGTWEERCAAVEAGTGYWNKHKHPFKWGGTGAIDPREGAPYPSRASGCRILTGTRYATRG